MTGTEPGTLTVRLEECVPADVYSTDGGFLAICGAYPEANGQGETPEDAISNLCASIRDLLSVFPEAD